MWKLTDKQKALADWIYDITGHKWEGGNPSDFTVYVNKYKQEAIGLSENQSLEHEAEMDIIDARRDW